jgi:cyclohexyl-isocyanide hydratase
VISDDIHLQIGLVAYEGLDQIDLTGPFEVLARLPNATTRIFAKTPAPVRDVRGFILTPDATFAEAPQLLNIQVLGEDPGPRRRRRVPG